METAIHRKQTSFRLRTDVLEILRKKAEQANRTLNNYVESLLIKDAYADEPNEVTKKAIKEAMKGKKDPKDVFDNVESMMKVLMKE
jgi:hypothetical protein